MADDALAMNELLHDAREILASAGVPSVVRTGKTATGDMAVLVRLASPGGAAAVVAAAALEDARLQLEGDPETLDGDVVEALAAGNELRVDRMG